MKKLFLFLLAFSLVPSLSFAVKSEKKKNNKISITNKDQTNQKNIFKNSNSQNSRPRKRSQSFSMPPKRPENNRNNNINLYLISLENNNKQTKQELQQFNATRQFLKERKNLQGKTKKQKKREKKNQYKKNLNAIRNNPKFFEKYANLKKFPSKDKNANQINKNPNDEPESGELGKHLREKIENNKLKKQLKERKNKLKTNKHQTQNYSQSPLPTKQQEEPLRFKTEQEALIYLQTQRGYYTNFDSWLEDYRKAVENDKKSKESNLFWNTLKIETYTILSKLLIQIGLSKALPLIERTQTSLYDLLCRSPQEKTASKLKLKKQIIEDKFKRICGIPAKTILSLRNIEKIKEQISELIKNKQLSDYEATKANDLLTLHTQTEKSLLQIYKPSFLAE